LNLHSIPHRAIRRRTWHECAETMPDGSCRRCVPQLELSDVLPAAVYVMSTRTWARAASDPTPLAAGPSLRTATRAFAGRLASPPRPDRPAPQPRESLAPLPPAARPCAGPDPGSYRLPAAHPAACCG